MKDKCISLKLAVIILICSMICIIFCPCNSRADKMDLTYISIRVDGKEIHDIPAYEANYVNNYFISLRSLSEALSETDARFNFYNDADGVFRIETGKAYDPSLEPEPDYDEDGEEYERPGTTYMAQGAYSLTIDDRQVTYYTFADYQIEDLYMCLLDVQMAFDFYFEYQNGIYNLLIIFMQFSWGMQLPERYCFQTMQISRWQ